MNLAQGLSGYAVEAFKQLKNRHLDAFMEV